MVVISRRIAAAAVSVALVTLLICDVSLRGFSAWWNAHSLSGDIVSSLLLLAVTGFVVDEVVARRQRKEREVAVAAQALIVYGQARRACEALGEPSTGESDLRATNEARDLASMVLTASSSLFDDAAGREFLRRVQRLMAALYVVSHAPPVGSEPGPLEQVKADMADLTVSVRPLMARVPPELLPALDELPGFNGAPT
jgi:hypothetical protein